MIITWSENVKLAKIIIHLDTHWSLKDIFESQQVYFEKRSTGAHLQILQDKKVIIMTGIVLLNPDVDLMMISDVVTMFLADIMHRFEKFEVQDQEQVEFNDEVEPKKLRLIDKVKKMIKR